MINRFITDNDSEFTEAESEDITSGSEYVPSEDEISNNKSKTQKAVPVLKKRKRSDSKSSQLSELDNVNSAKRKKLVKVSTKKLDLSNASKSSKLLSPAVSCAKSSKKRERSYSDSTSKSELAAPNAKRKKLMIVSTPKLDSSNASKSTERSESTSDSDSSYSALSDSDSTSKYDSEPNKSTTNKTNETKNLTVVLMYPSILSQWG